MAGRTWRFPEGAGLEPFDILSPKAGARFTKRNLDAGSGSFGGIWQPGTDGAAHKLALTVKLNNWHICNYCGSTKIVFEEREMSFKASALVAALMLWAGNASATTIFADDFNRAASNTVGNGWVETEDAPNGVTLLVVNFPYTRHDTGVMWLESNSPDGAAANGAFSTVGYINISLTFDWYNRSVETTDHLYVQWKKHADSGWTTAGTYTASGSSVWHDEVVVWLTGAEGQNIDIRFLTKVSNTYEGYKIDNVILAGVLDPNDQTGDVPLPGALPLFASVVALVGGAAYRRKRSAAKAVA